MRTYSVRSTVVSALGVVLWLAMGSASAQAVYRLTDLGTLGGTHSEGQSINAAGQVAGYSYLLGDTVLHAFLWKDNMMTDLTPLLESTSLGFGINAIGQVTGSACSKVGGVCHAVLWNGTTMTDLGTLGPAPSGLNSQGFGINDAGHVTGWSWRTKTAIHTAFAFLWDGTTMQGLFTPSQGADINAAGQVTGGYFFADTAQLHAFIWNGAAFTDLGTMGGTESEGLGINAAGQVVGYSYLLGDTVYHAFLWKDNMMTDLGTLGGTESVGNRINAAGQVTGSSSTSVSAFYHAFLWDGTKSPPMRDLDDLIDPADPLQGCVFLTQGWGINDLGQVVATGYDTCLTHQYHAYVVSPPPAQQAAILQTAATGVGAGGSLAGKVGNAQTAYAAGNTKHACAELRAFIHELSAPGQRKHIGAANADALVADAQALEKTFGCQ
jgi:probable HAF family extracellular repeat protein